MDFVSRLLSKISKPGEFSVGAQNSSARASSFSMAAASFGAAGAEPFSALRARAMHRICTPSLLCGVMGSHARGAAPVAGAEYLHRNTLRQLSLNSEATHDLSLLLSRLHC